MKASEVDVVNPPEWYRPPAPFEFGNQAATKHGADSQQRLAPIVVELRAWLAEVAPWTTQVAAFAPTVEAWATAEAQSIVYRRWFDERAMVSADDEAPGLGNWARAEARAAKLRDELGLSPAALARLLAGLSKIDAPQALSGLEALKAAGAATAAAAVSELTSGGEQ